MECSRRVAHENDAKSTRYMMCNYGATAPLWESKMQVAVKNTPAAHENDAKAGYALYDV